MSQNFSVLLSAPLSELGPTLVDMAKRLRQRGFHHDATLVRLELGEDIDAPETEIPFHLTETRINPSWNGVSTSFFFPSELTLDVIICRWQSDFLNIYIEAPIRVLADI